MDPVAVTCTPSIYEKVAVGLFHRLEILAQKTRKTCSIVINSNQAAGAYTNTHIGDLALP